MPSDTELTNQTLTGLPLAISDGAGVHSGQVKLHFNPSLLHLTGSYAIGFIVCGIPALLVGFDLLRAPVPEPSRSPG